MTKPKANDAGGAAAVAEPAKPGPTLDELLSGMRQTEVHNAADEQESVRQNRQLLFQILVDAALQEVKDPDIGLYLPDIMEGAKVDATAAERHAAAINALLRTTPAMLSREQRRLQREAAHAEYQTKLAVLEQAEADVKTAKARFRSVGVADSHARPEVVGAIVRLLHNGASEDQVRRLLRCDTAAATELIDEATATIDRHRAAQQQPMFSAFSRKPLPAGT